MAATASVDISIEGRGGHAAKPHRCIDSLLVGAQLVTAMQQVVARNVDPLDSAVLSLCQFNTGNARNVIPQTAEIHGTVRTLKRDVANMVEKRMHEICKGVGQMTDASINLKFEHFYPVTMNHPAQTEVAARVAKEIAGEANVYEMPPMMGGEDFSYMLQARPGAFIFCGNGDTAELHHPAYNFTDEAIVHGSSYWIKLVENTLAS
jgi:hippurate hydrolase